MEIEVKVGFRSCSEAIWKKKKNFVAETVKVREKFISEISLRGSVCDICEIILLKNGNGFKRKSRAKQICLYRIDRE